MDVSEIAHHTVDDLIAAYRYEKKMAEDDSMNTPEDWDPMDDEDTLTYAVTFCLGAEYHLTQGSSGDLEFRHASLTLGYGGPGVVFHTSGWVEVRWGTDSTRVSVPKCVCEAADELIAALISGLRVA